MAAIVVPSPFEQALRDFLRVRAQFISAFEIGTKCAEAEGVMRMNKLERPREIIEYCLTPLGLSASSAEYKEVYRRLEHVIKTLQVMAARNNNPVAVDFSGMKTININEAAHGDDA
ncbi:MAG: hypothetical protein L0Y57_01290 [Beijerinckiaceae bacterium]|nr:hypothetical protein [Beijerinckiaceae bacterium]